MDEKALIAEFDCAMHRIYQRAYSEAGYRATRFLQMLEANRGVLTAKLLIHAPTVSEGYTALWERGRLDLTVEAMIHDNPKWHPLFSAEELAICRERLQQYEYIE